MQKLLLIFSCLSLPLLGSASLSAQIIYGLQYDAPFTQNNGQFNLIGVNPFLVQPDTLFPITGSRNVVAASSTFDHANHRYIYWGNDSAGNYRFYAVDVQNGNLVFNPVAQGNPIEIQYDLQNAVPYGLEWDPVSQEESFVTVDLSTGTTHSLAVIPGVRSVVAGSSCFDSNNGRYFFIGQDSNFQRHYYSINVNNGQVLLMPAVSFPNNGFIRDPKYDLNNNKIYCMWSVPDSTIPLQPVTQLAWRKTYFAELDSTTAQITILNNTPLLEGYSAGYALGSTDYDQNTQTYLFVGKEDYDPDFSLFLVQASTGSILSSVAFSPGNPIYELEVDNQNFANKTYNTTTNLDKTVFRGAVQVFHNLTNDQLKLSIELTSPDKVEIQIQTLWGQEIQRRYYLLKAENNEQILEVGELPKGLYILQIIDSGGRVWSERFLIR